MKIQRKTLRSLMLAIFSLLLGTGRLAAVPTNWELVYGKSTYYEQALKGAVAVQACSGGGYVSVGYTRRTDTRTDSDVYVVHTSEAGGLIWQRTIDISGHYSDDMGTSVREVRHSTGGGFVVTGTTAPSIGADRDVFLLKLGCNGSLAWTVRLRTASDQLGSSTDDVANDVMETDTGSAAPAGSATPGLGDFVVAGSSRRQVGTSVFDTDAYLVRTNSSGYVLWSRTYANWGSSGSSDDHPIDLEWFNAVSEAQPTTGQSVGDVLAAGAQANTGWQDGLAVRVSGTSGALTLPLHTMAIFNIPTSEAKERLTELWASRELHQAGTEHLNIVVVGTIAEDGSAPDGYIAKTGPNLGSLLAQQAIGDGFGGTETEGFADVQEIVAPTSYASAGNLAVTGYATINGSQDVALLALDAGTLRPVAGTGYLFGDHGELEERGTALVQVLAIDSVRTAGFYINGSALSDPLQSGDPEDMYLIKTDATGQTYCSVSWSPGYDTDDDTCSCDEHDEDPGTFSESASSATTSPSWGGAICQ